MRHRLLAILLCVIFLAACSPKAAAPALGGVAEPMPAQPEAAPSDKAFGYGGGGGAADEAYTLQGPSVERMVVQNVDMLIVVPDPKEKLQAVTALANSMGGFVVSSNIYQSQTESGITVPEATITIRVPAERLDEALEKIKLDVTEVRRENRSGQDVTKEYVDLQSRLRTYEDAEEQLRVILEQKTSPEEVLNVFNQMMYYREQIELIKGQMKYYEEAAALSAVSITILADEKVKPLEIGKWRLEGTARDAAQALINFYQGFVKFLIWLVILIIPVAVTILALLWVLWKLIRLLWRLFFSRRKAVPPPPVEQK